MVERGLRRRFDALVEREARLASPSPEGRNDLRSLPTFTIDPPTARDFDDAISAEELPDGAVRLWVHIADVCAYVTPGSALDREAFRRANSVYVPGLVEPMLPETLSNGACSLVPGVDRLAVTVELEFDGAHVRRSAFHRSVIRSDERYDYPQVDAMFASGDVPGPVATARKVAAALAARRGGLAIESSEPEFTFTREGHVESVAPSEATESHRLIEMLMIAANEAVAGLLESRKLPAVYRVHEPPDRAVRAVREQRHPAARHRVDRPLAVAEPGDGPGVRPGRPPPGHHAAAVHRRVASRHRRGGSGR